MKLNYIQLSYKHLFVEKLENGISIPKKFYHYTPNKITIITGYNFSGKEDFISNIFLDINYSFFRPSLENFSYVLSNDAIKSVFPYFKNNDRFTLEKLHNILQTITIINNNIEIDKHIFLDYPENNLYCSEQALLIDFICENVYKRNGIFLISTNSDYIVNGILRNVKNGVIKNTDVDILHVGSPEEVGICVEEKNKSKTVIGKCYIKENGRIKAFDGFFNQYNKDMQSLL